MPVLECASSFLFHLCQVAHIKDYLPKACPHGDSIILDSEVCVCAGRKEVCVCVRGGRRCVCVYCVRERLTEAESSAIASCMYVMYAFRM